MEFQPILDSFKAELQAFKSRITRLLIAAILAALAGGGTVAFRGCGGSTPPPSTAPASPPSTPPPLSPPLPPFIPKFDPINAVCRIQFGNAGCSATVIGIPLPDGRRQLLTAAHCLRGQPTEGVAYFRDGRSVRIRQQGHWDGPDVGWLITDLPQPDLPYTLLSEVNPVAGQKVYHCGFGVDVPGNREDGTVVQPDNGQGQTQYRISVSSGDSGGGIAFDSNGHVLSPVCCTTAKGRVADVWGATVAECKRLRPGPVLTDDGWTPIEIPIRMPQ